MSNFRRWPQHNSVPPQHIVCLSNYEVRTDGVLVYATCWGRSPHDGPHERFTRSGVAFDTATEMHCRPLCIGSGWMLMKRHEHALRIPGMALFVRLSLCLWPVCRSTFLPASLVF